MDAGVSPELAGPLARSAQPELSGPAQGARVPLLRRPIPVGVLGAALAALAFATYGRFSDGAIAAFMAGVLVVVAATDLERRIIPNQIVLPATAIVLVARIAATPGRTLEYLLAGLCAGLFFLIPNLINGSLMGMGDVKLAAFLGAGLGLSVVAAITVAFLSVFPFALAMVVRGGRSARGAALPFGPFLAFGGILILILPRLVGLGGG